MAAVIYGPPLHVWTIVVYKHMGRLMQQQCAVVLAAPPPECNGNVGLRK